MVHGSWLKALIVYLREEARKVVLHSMESGS